MGEGPVRARAFGRATRMQSRRGTEKSGKDVGGGGGGGVAQHQENISAVGPPHLLREWKARACMRVRTCVGKGKGRAQ